MLNITKLYLAKHHNLSIDERSHFATRIALEHVLTEQRVKKKAIDLLTKAEETFESFTPINKHPRTLAIMLGAAQKKRERASYYSHPPPHRESAELKSFFKSIVEPFLAIIEGMR